MRFTLAHPECPANIREHSDFVGGTEAMLKYLAKFAGAARFPGRHRSQHDVADAEQVPAASLSSGAGHHLRLQQMPAHGAQHAGKTARLPGARAARKSPGSPNSHRRQKCCNAACFLKILREDDSVIPHLFLLRLAYPCVYRKEMPQVDADDLLDLPESCKIENFTPMDGGTVFADVRSGLE